jgi:arabinofuranosyltransferase
VGRRLLLVAVPAGVYAVLGWTHRWVSDDGLITLRVVAQVLAGHGPVFNVGERVEASTSAAWTWLLVVAGWLFPVALPSLAVGVGLVAGTAGLAVALDATGRLWRSRPGATRLVPAGVLIVLALPPFWEFATSGLETGLTVGWTGVCWWLLVRAALARPGPRWAVGAAVVLGVGPLVRPDLAVVSAVLLLALVAVLRPGARRALALAAAAGALPLAYQVFRAGYYGSLVPTPALAKEATLPRWDQGAVYLLDLLRPYWLPVPLLALLVAALAAGRPARLPGPRRMVLAAPVVAGLVSWLYVVRVGGDFMHARLLLPGLWCLLLPVLVLPLGGRVARTALAATVAWAAVCALALRVPYGGGIGPRGIADERGYHVVLSGHDRNPTRVEDYAGTDYAALGRRVRAEAAAGRRLLVAGSHTLPLAVEVRHPAVIQVYSLGIAGATAGLEVAVLDSLGLADPVAARLRLRARGRPGHEKSLPAEWVIARYAEAGDETDRRVDPAAVRAARHALACGDLKALDEAVRAPLTAARFVGNLRRAWRLTTLRVEPLDPAAGAAARTSSERAAAPGLSSAPPVNPAPTAALPAVVARSGPGPCPALLSSR